MEVLFLFAGKISKGEFARRNHSGKSAEHPAVEVEGGHPQAPEKMPHTHLGRRLFLAAFGAKNGFG